VTKSCKQQTKNGSCEMPAQEGHDKCIYHRLQLALFEEAENTERIKNFHENFHQVIRYW
jgi:hypothetical protein